MIRDGVRVQIVDGHHPHEFRYISNMTLLWGTYGALRHDNVVNAFRNNPTAFRRLVQHCGTTFSMGYFKAREVKVPGRGYTVLEDVGDPLNKVYLADGGLPIDELYFVRKETMDRIFKNVQQKRTRRMCGTILIPDVVERSSTMPLT